MRNLIIFLIILLNGCSTPTLSKKGEEVQVIMDMPKEKCVNLGPVFSESNNQFIGDFVTNKDLLRRATVKLRNEVADLGGTHVLIKGHSISEVNNYAYKNKTASSATFTGIAFKCKLKV